MRRLIIESAVSHSRGARKAEALFLGIDYYLKMTEFKNFGSDFVLNFYLRMIKFKFLPLP